MTWTSHPDGRPPFGRRARAWFARRMDATAGELMQSPALLATADAVSPTAPGVAAGILAAEREVRAVVVAWFVERADTFVRWEDYDEYRGPGYAAGAWKVDDAAVRRTFPDVLAFALEAAAQAHDAPHHASLDTWLAADLRGELVSAGPAEPRKVRTRGTDGAAPTGRRPRGRQGRRGNS